MDTVMDRMSTVKSSSILWNNAGLDEETLLTFICRDLHNKVTSNVGWRTDSSRVQSERLTYVRQPSNIY